jgi:hypothetical protein
LDKYRKWPINRHGATWYLVSVNFINPSPTAPQHSVAALDSILWATGFLGHLILLVVLLIRRRVREFPVFTSFIAYVTMRTMALFLIWRYGSVYAYKLGYWMLSPGDYAFQIAIIFEMGRNVLRPTGNLGSRCADGLSDLVCGWHVDCGLYVARDHTA